MLLGIVLIAVVHLAVSLILIWGLGILGSQLHQLRGDLMAANQKITEFLDRLDTYTSDMAATQRRQTEKIVEIAAGVRRLIDERAGELSPDILARLESTAAGLAEAVAFEAAQAETLDNVAAQASEPLPEPIIPVDPPQ